MSDRALWLAVLHQALDDARASRRRDRIALWLRCQRDDFNAVCALADVEPAHMVSALAAALAAPPTKVGYE